MMMRIGEVLPGNRDDGNAIARRIKLNEPTQAGPFHSLERFTAEKFRQSVSQSTDPPAAEVALVRGILLDIGGIPLFRSVGMMFMLHQLLVF
jgi:hypothetical protein